MNQFSILMQEHRLIEKMLHLFNIEIKKIHEQHLVNTMFVDTATDFIRTYMDLTHHGKEENILFRDLAIKSLLPEQTKIMDELIAEHKCVREIGTRLVEAKQRYLHGQDMYRDFISILKELTNLYPQHIEKEEEHFYYPALDYFTEAEQDKMMDAFREFDKDVIHWKYRKAAAVLEERLWTSDF